MMAILSNPAFWASIGALLSAIGLEMIPAQELAEHVVALVAGISGIVGIIYSYRSSRQPPAEQKLEKSVAELEKAITEEKP